MERTYCERQIVKFNKQNTIGIVYLREDTIRNDYIHIFILCTRQVLITANVYRKTDA